MALAPRVWLIPTKDSEIVECAFSKVLCREPPSLTTLASRVIGRRISYPSNCSQLVSQLPAIVLGDVRRHALCSMICGRCAKLEWSELGYSVRLAIIYHLLDRSWDFSYAKEFLPRIWGALELGENLTPLIEVVEELVIELESIARAAYGATIEWFVGVDRRGENNSSWPEVRFFLRIQPNKKNVEIRRRHWEVTEYNPNCGQIKIEMDQSGRMNSFAVKNIRGFQFLLMDTNDTTEIDNDFSQISAVLKNIWLRDRTGQRGCDVELT